MTERMETEAKWTVRGKYVMITGATSGIGLAAAKALAARGAILGIVARNPAKAEEAVARIREAAEGRDVTVDVFLADMASQSSIRRAAEDILGRWPRIDVLVNNAGAMFVTRKLTDDGQEMTWAVNHLGPFLLTKLLLDRLKESVSARVITTASHGHKMAKKGIRFDDLTAKRLYSFPQSLLGGANFRYGETKLANILFTAELAKRLEGTGVSAYSFDPGLVSTNFNQDNGWLARMTMAVMRLFSRTPEKGAETLVWLADSDAVSGRSGGYYADLEEALPAASARDAEAAKRLWEVSELQTRSFAR
ncbi:SDR family NAD(P)-dependent oxidoreductase [Cohnella nanjingensis]|uniref:SDR family NAD(P)-dependent oxidoreductase n=1 Tax=Cohnella nanjingensis TaxID=1387779 RepID=A0A7X0RQ16_9BACL|nr:SDR family NAD(P)-dependent oxidoreductase [Cohnella nanjingensis]MBB6671568.1 SDR family NAD(P)-dependent oxidoreductase [Cohnella nanjingensis]